MRVYLDNCCYNRPFDDQRQLKIRLETMAKVGVQLLMWIGKIEYVWSDVLDYEVSRNPHRNRTSLIMPWRKKAVTHIDKRLSVLGTMKVSNPTQFVMEEYGYGNDGR